MKRSIEYFNKELQKNHDKEYILNEYKGMIVKFQPSDHGGWCGMEHFEKEGFAIIQYSYAEKYGGDDYDSVGLFHLDSGQENSWYHCSRNLIPATKQEIDALRKEGYKI